MVMWRIAGDEDNPPDECADKDCARGTPKILICSSDVPISKTCQQTQSRRSGQREQDTGRGARR